MVSSKSPFVLIGLLGIILLLSFEVVSARELAQQTEEKVTKADFEEKNINGRQGWFPGSSSGYAYGFGYPPGNGYGYQPGNAYGYQPGNAYGYGIPGGPYYGGIPHVGYFGGYP
ncbi:hypothetical protein DsansV1_C13g0117451 [Dioscorea sansibarensis]